MPKHWWVRAAVFGAVVLSAVAGSALTRTRSTATTPTAAPALTSTPWLTRLAAVERAVADGDLSLAIYRWHDAHAEALRSRRWDALADVGDAAVEIDRALYRALRNGQSFRAPARRAYLEALVRARTVGSEDGIRRIAAAFAALGDTEMAEQARAIAPAVPTVQVER